MVKYYDRSKDTLIRLAGKPGPLVLIPNVSEDPVIKLAAAMAVGYSKAPDGSTYS